MSEDRHSGVPGGNGSGADVKSGTILDVDDGNSAVVVFGTPFSSVPEITLTKQHGSVQATDIPQITVRSVTGFTLRLHKGHGGSAHTYAIFWIATDAGDP